MKRISFFLLFLSLFFISDAQKYMTKNGFIGFFSHTPVEDIKADNNQVASVLDISTGEMAFQVLIKSFHFEKALMETHFNESFLESDKFPRSSFKGKIVNLSVVDFTKTGKYEATVEGALNIHDVTKNIKVSGTVEVLPEGITANAKFNIAPEDYNIKIPAVVRENIAKIIEVTVLIKYTPIEK
jgi:YceI-like domain